MAQIDVTTHWRSPSTEVSHPVRLRIIQDHEKTLALLSAPTGSDLEVEQSLNDQLDHEFQYAATSVATVFSLNPLETVWLREITIEGRSHVRRVIMDEQKGALINPRSGVLTPWESSVSQNIDRYFSRKKSARKWSWRTVLGAGLLHGMLIAVIILYGRLDRETLLVASKERELESVRKELEESTRKVLTIDLIERERQTATGSQSNLKRIYRQTTNAVTVKPPLLQSEGR